MRVIGVFILLLLIGCGLLSFFAFQRGGLTETAVMPPVAITAAEGSVMEVLIVTAVPELDAPLLTATTVIREATERVLSMTPLPTRNNATQTEVAYLTAYPAELLQDCSPGDLYATRDSELGGQLYTAAQTEDILYLGQVIVTFVSDDCQSYRLDDYVLSIIVPPQVEEDKRDDYLDSLAEIVVANPLALERLVSIQVILENSREYQIPFADYLQNYEDSLHGEALFTERD